MIWFRPCMTRRAMLMSKILSRFLAVSGMAREHSTRPLRWAHSVICIMGIFTRLCIMTQTRYLISCRIAGR